MILRVVFIVLLLTTPSAAKLIEVKSGEHSDFSRLVIYSRNIESWEIKRNGRLIHLKFQGVNKRFNFDKVFKYIPKIRLQSIAQSGNGFLLTLNCDCALEISRISNIGIMIDIKDDLVEYIRTQNIRNQSNSEYTQIHAIKSKEHATKTNFQEKFLRVSNHHTYSLNKNNDERYINSFNIKDSSKIIKHDLKLRNHMRASSSTLNSGSIYTETERDMQTRCTESQLPIVQNWQSAKTFNEQVGQLNSIVIDESGKIDHAAIINLARFYLSYAMTNEVDNLLENGSSKNKESEIILKISKIISKYYLNNNSDFSLGCQNEIAIWKLLIHGTNKPISNLIARKAAMEFLQLSKQIRFSIGPTLSEILRNSDNKISAEVVENSLKRSNSPSYRRITMETAPRPMLISMIDKNNENSIPAIRALFSLNWKEKTPMSDDTRLIVESHIAQAGMEHTDNDLIVGLARDSILKENFNEALKIAYSASSELDLTVIMNEISIASTNTESKIDFIEVSSSMHKNGMMKYITSDQKLIVAQRLEMMGLNDLITPTISNLEKHPNYPSKHTSSTPESDSSKGLETSMLKKAQDTINKSSALRKRLYDLASPSD